IRDRTVTGVQTCALPILSAAAVTELQRLLSIRAGPLRLVAAAVEGAHLAVGRGVGPARAADRQRAVVFGGAGEGRRAGVEAPLEIGRASCRGRGEGWR